MTQTIMPAVPVCPVSIMSATVREGAVVTRRNPRESATESDDDRPSLSVEDEVRATLDDAPEISAAHRALVATALTLARKLDDGAGMATAAVAKELRATLDAILKEAGDDDDGLDGFVNGLGLPTAGVSPLG
jgi:hypothetical protein